MTRSISCPNCGSASPLTTGPHRYRCDHCGSAFEVEQAPATHVHVNVETATITGGESRADLLAVRRELERVIAERSGWLSAIKYDHERIAIAKSKVQEQDLKIQEMRLAHGRKKRLLNVAGGIVFVVAGLLLLSSGHLVWGWVLLGFGLICATVGHKGGDDVTQLWPSLAAELAHCQRALSESEASQATRRAGASTCLGGSDAGPAEIEDALRASESELARVNAALRKHRL